MAGLMFVNEQNNISQKTGFVKITKPVFLPYFFNKKTEYIVQAPAYFCIAAIIGAKRLNFRVRDGNGCDPLAHGT